MTSVSPWIILSVSTLPSLVSILVGLPIRNWVRRHGLWLPFASVAGWTMFGYLLGLVAALSLNSSLREDYVHVRYWGAVLAIPIALAAYAIVAAVESSLYRWMGNIPVSHKGSNARTFPLAACACTTIITFVTYFFGFIRPPL